jgi:hypothetical protein
LRGRRLAAIGVAVTGLYGVFLVWIAWSDWPDFKELRPNEWGDSSLVDWDHVRYFGWC